MNNAANCGNGEFVEAQTISITQDDTAISILTAHGNIFSGTVDNFEMVATQVLSGRTNYIGVFSMVTTGDASYNRSIDLN